jgi:hypothetical protein
MDTEGICQPSHLTNHSKATLARARVRVNVAMRSSFYGKAGWFAPKLTESACVV